MNSRSKKQRAYHYGLWAEWWCIAALVLTGHRILERRHRNSHGEIDLIAKRGKQLVFIEVKARQRLEDGLYALQPHQQQRILRAASAYLANHPAYQELRIRFDFMVVSGVTWPKHIRHAFEA